MKPGQKQQVRIISGQWRGRKLDVPDIFGLRPTPDRVRETVFNWLVAKCPGSTVLDCFAGSGVLGFEALSRDAREVTLIEQNVRAFENLQFQSARLNCDRISVLNGDAIALIPELNQPFDLVFIDPPYILPHLRYSVLEALSIANKLNEHAFIYLEWPLSESFELPQDFYWIKRKKAGQVHYALAEWRGSV